MLHLLQDRQWRLHNLYHIEDKGAHVVRFKPNPIQEVFFRTFHWRNNVLKARQFGMCLDPSTRVLTADLRWVPISDIEVGQELIGVDEHAPKGRKMRTCKVLRKFSSRLPSYRIRFDDGRAIICSGRHPWLSCTPSGEYVGWRTIESQSKKKLSAGKYVRWVTRPWGASEFEDGWFGGMADGEGSMTVNGAASLCVAQREGPIFDRLRAYCEKRGICYTIEGDLHPVRDGKFGVSPVPKVVIGRMNELFRVIGLCRPGRFIGARWWEGRDLPGKKSGEGWARIVDIEPLGARDLVDIQTTTATYIAEGFVSHNSTAIDILGLDTCLFTSNVSAAIIAHEKEAASEIYRTKVKIPFEKLVLNDQELQGFPPGFWARFCERMQPKIDRKGEMVFPNGSRIAVTTSTRSGTVHFLHVSELGKIARKYPEKAKEIKTGAIEAVPEHGLLFIESTAEGREGYHYDICEHDIRRSQTVGMRPLAPMERKFFFFPWWKHPGYVTNPAGVLIPDRLVRYFDETQAKCKTIFTPEQRAWYALKEGGESSGAGLGEDMLREYPSTPEEAFHVSIEGTYFRSEMARARRERRIGLHPVTDGVPIDTSWDIGNDTTAIWFWQTIGGRPRAVAYYEHAGEGLPYYLRELRRMEKDFGWRIQRIVWPHDGKNADWGIGTARAKIAEREGFHVVDIVPRVDYPVGHEAIRTLLNNCEIDEEQCAKGINCLDNYRKEWNEQRGCWRDIPLHDWASHGTSAFKTYALHWHKQAIGTGGSSGGGTSSYGPSPRAWS